MNPLMRSRNTLGSAKMFQTAAPLQRGFATMEKTFLASDMKIKLREKLLEKPGPDHSYSFGAIATDHMLEIDYDYTNGGW